MAGGGCFLSELVTMVIASDTTVVGDRCLQAGQSCYEDLSIHEKSVGVDWRITADTCSLATEKLEPEADGDEAPGCKDDFDSSAMI